MTPWPIQTELQAKDYPQYREKAFSQIDPSLDQCAKFVNRLLAARFEIQSFGNAWNMQLHPDNAPYFDLLWRIDESDFDRQRDFLTASPAVRIKHFQDLYTILDQQENPAGVLGFMYRYSFHKDKLVKQDGILPQTHITFVAGRTTFEWINETENPKTLQKILEDQFGMLQDYEIEFLKTRINLEKIMAPQEAYTYTDYLIEHQFKGLKAESLLEIFLKKHTGNRLTPLLRPVSYSKLNKKFTQESVTRFPGASVVHLPHHAGP